MRENKLTIDSFLDNGPIERKKFANCIDQLSKGYDRIFISLSPGERDYIRKFFSLFMAGQTDIIDALYKYDYDHKIVSPQDFIFGKDYLGNWPFIRKPWLPHIYEIYNNDRLLEVILFGALGTGKTTIGSGVLPAVFLYKLLALRNPSRFWGLGDKAHLIIGIYSITLESAEDAGFRTFRDKFIRGSPFFRQYLKDDTSPGRIEFYKNVTVLVGSNSLHQAGKDIFAITIDEINIAASGGEKKVKKAYKLADDVRDRLFTRFIQSGGNVPGVVIFSGSAETENSFCEKRIKKKRNDKRVKIVEGAIWDFKKFDSSGKSLYSGQTFRVQAGKTQEDCAILDDVIQNENETFTIIEKGHPSPKAEVIEVPVEFYPRFSDNIMTSLKNLAGFSSASIDTLLVESRVDKVMDNEIKNPFPDIVHGYLGSKIQIFDSMDKELICRVVEGKYVPKYHPNSPRYISVDLAKNEDFAGVAMVHPSKHIVTKDSLDNGIAKISITKDILVDFAFAISWGPKKEPIDFEKIRMLIFFVKEMGFWIRKVTYDTWNSEDSIQRLYDARINAGNYSVDKTPDAYLTLRNIINAERMVIPYVRLLRNELVKLIYDKIANKVDHPPGGSKDIADAVTAASYQCLIDRIRPEEVEEYNRRQRYRKKKTYSEFLPEMKMMQDIMQEEMFI